jgi:translocation and assembly module TamB
MGFSPCHGNLLANPRTNGIDSGRVLDDTRIYIMATVRSMFHPDPDKDPTPTPAHQPQHRWRRVLSWISGIFLLLNVLIAVTVLVLLHSQRFHNYILAKVQTIATENLNAQVNLQNFALHFSPLGLDVYGVTIHGAAPYPNPPVLQVEHAHVGIRIVSLLSHKWYLSDVTLNHPIVQIYVDKNGVSNIPKPKPSNSKSNTTIWDLGIRHTVLDRGEIYYNAQATPLYADLHDLDLHATYDALRTMYSGELKYDNGRVVFGAFQPFEHNFDAQFDATPTTFQLHRAQLTSNAAQVNIVATANNFSNPHVEAKYQVNVDGAQAAKLLNNPSIPTGTIRATGSAVYQQVPNKPALESVTLNGDLLSKQLRVKTSSMQAAIDNLSAHYSIEHGNAVLHDLSAGLLGGQISAHGAMNGLGGPSPHNEMFASLHNVSLSDADRTALQRALPASMKSIAISGTLNANAQATWGKDISGIVAKVDSSVHGEAIGNLPATSVATVGPNGKPQPTTTQVPIDAEIHATYNGASKSIALNNSYIRTPQSTINLNGDLSNHSSMALHLHFANLTEIAGIINMLQGPNKPGQPPSTQMQLAGSADFNGTLTGSTSAPHIKGEFTAHDLEVNGSAWKSVRTGIDADPSQARLINADLEPLPKGHIGLNASVGLHKWAFSKTSPLNVDLNATQLDIASLTKIAKQDLPVSGTLNTRVTLHGSMDSPTGNGNLSITKAVAYNEPIDSVQINFGGTGDQAHATLAVNLPAGSIHSDVTVNPKQKTYTARLTSTGIEIQKLETVKAKNLNATGTVAINASGQGSFDNPQLTASIQIPSLAIQNQKVANIKLDANVANHVANAVLTSAAMNTNIAAKARVNLTGDYETDATLDTQNIPLQPIVAIYSPANASTLSGATELHATVHGPIKNKSALQAHVTIPYLNVDYNNTIHLAAVAPIHADFANSVLTVQHSAIKGTATNLEFQASVPVGSKAPMSLLLKGDIDMSLAQIFNPDIRTSGQVRFNIDSHGMSASDIGGEIDLVNLNYASADLPVGLQNGNGVLKLTTDRVNIQSFSGTVGGGEVTASGGVTYRPSLQFNLGMAAKNIRVLYPQGMREAIDANIHLAGTTDNALLGGTVDLTNISFTPAFDLTSFVGQFSGGAPAPPTVGGVTQNIHLNIAVHSTNNVNLISRTLSVNGSANLQVRGTADNPVILGRINLSGGDILLNNDRFVLDGGTIQFINPNRTQPDVNVSITTTIQQYNISMRFRGPTDQMQTQYTSDPALPEADIIHLLAFGETTEASGKSTATPTQMAQSAVANQVSSQVTSRFAKVAGISQLSISPVLGNSQSGQQAGANITIQQRVTGNLFVTFSTNTADSTQTIQGQYKVSPKLSFSATRSPNGGFAVDALIKKEY